MRSLPALVFSEDRIIQLVERGEFFLVNEIKLAKVGQLGLLIDLSL